MAQQTEHAHHPASSPSRPRAAWGSGSRRALQRGGRHSRRWSECRKSLQAPGLVALRRQDRGGQCAQEEGSDENEMEGIEEGITVHGPNSAVAADVGPPVINCTLAAWTPENDANGLFYFGAGIICDGLPAHLQVKVCGQEFSHGHWHNIGCSPVEQDSDVGFSVAATIALCTPHTWLRTWAWGWGQLSDGSESEGTDESGEMRC